MILRLKVHNAMANIYVHACMCAYIQFIVCALDSFSVIVLSSAWRGSTTQN